MARAIKLRRSNFCILKDSVLFEMLKTETLIFLRQGFHLRQGYDVTRRRDKEGEIDGATPRSYSPQRIRPLADRLIVIGYQVSNCRTGASPTDPWNGKRKRLPYKSVIRCQRKEIGEQRAAVFSLPEHRCSRQKFVE